MFSITSASPKRIGDGGEIIVPAIHVGLGPGVSSDGVEILPGPRNDGHWLFERGDTLIVRIASGPAVIIVTTLRTGPTPTISLKMTRLDRVSPEDASTRPAGLPAAAVEAPKTVAAPVPVEPVRAAGAVRPPPLKTADGRRSVDVQIDLHIENKGDVSYVNNFWAGALGERLAIEGFVISALEGLRPDQIEYAAIAEDGGETGWIGGGKLCGSRGAARPLAGFAVRLRHGETLPFTCEYRGSFSSGRLVGPVRDGAPCRSEAGDRLEAIQLFIVPRLAGEQVAAPSAGLASAAKRTPEAPANRPIGPRFSVFRETSEP
jgi:hypothetical protein